MSGQPVAVRLKKEYGLRLLDAIRNGGPITRTDPGGQWTVFDMLAVAGACLFGAWSHGPAVPQPDLGTAQQEADDEEHIKSIVNAADFLSHAFAALQDGTWEFDEMLNAVITGNTVQTLGRQEDDQEPDL